MASSPSDGDLPIHWRLRPDVQVFPHDDLSAVLKDPLTGNYMLLVEHEYAALTILEKSSRLSEWHERLLRAFPGSGVSCDDLKAFLLRLCRHQVLQSAIVSNSMATTSTAPRGPGVLLKKALSACFRIRLPIARPTQFAERLTRRLWFLFTPAATILYFATILLAVAIVGVRFAEFRSEIPTLSILLSTANLPWLFVMFVVVKMLHEFGHIVACSNFGAKVRDCGFLLLFFTPVLYTNVSDSWILPRRSRMMISMAGILVELGLAAIFVVLWWISEAGQVRYLLMNGILLCTVSTLLFNGNPLLKFDGYFVLADLIRCPNLYQRSITETCHFCQTLWQHSLRGAVAGVSDRRFLTFGVLVCLYRVLLCIGLCSIAGAAATGVGLSPLDLPIRILLLATLAVMPVYAFVRSVARDAGQEGSRMRLAFRTLLIVGFVWMILLIPVPGTLNVPCVFIPDGQPIYADLTGRLVSTVGYGATVGEGTEIVQLENDELQDQLLAAESDYGEKLLRVENLKKLGMDRSSQLLPTAIESSAAAERQLKLLRYQVEQLRITTTQPGILLPPEETADSGPAVQLQKWTGTPLSKSNMGATIERGTLLGYAGQPKTVRAMAVLNDDQVEQMSVGQPASALLLSGGRNSITTNVSDVSSMEASDLPKCLLSLPENQWLIQERVHSERAVYAMSCLLEADDRHKLPALYSRGVLKVDGIHTTLGTTIMRFLRTTIFRTWI
jgi:putative peptide zinc metalloprotease protein